VVVIIIGAFIPSMPLLPKHGVPVCAVKEPHFSFDLMIASDVPGKHVRMYSAHHSKHTLIGAHVRLVTWSE
jgi:hypothetical protein